MKKTVNMKNKRMAHAAALKTRVETSRELHALYFQLKDDAVLQDILKRAQEFVNYHSKIGRDAVGFKNSGRKDEHGNDIQELVYFTAEQRLREMDKAAGIEELTAYIERMCKELPPAKKPVSDTRSVA